MHTKTAMIPMDKTNLTYEKIILSIRKQQQFLSADHLPGN